MPLNIRICFFSSVKWLQREDSQTVSSNLWHKIPQFWNEEDNKKRRYSYMQSFIYL